MKQGKTYAYVWFFASIALIICSVALFIIYSSTFERNPPKTDAPSTIVWNVKSPLKLNIFDDSGIKEYKISIVDGNKMTTLANETLDKSQKSIDLNLSYPKDAFIPSQNAYVSITMKDKSLWGWFGGNGAIFKIPLITDSIPPQIKILSNSQAIYKGGAATIIFSAIDDSKVTSAWVESSNGDKFIAQQLDKNNTYVTIAAWNLLAPKITLYACSQDFAGNVAKVPISILMKDIIYKTSKINVSSQVIDNKISHFCANTPRGAITDPVECFVYVNNILRVQNEELIAQVTKRIGNSIVTSFFKEPFLPITKAQVVGSYGDHRVYELNGKPISESYHLGIDFASLKEAAVVAPNNGVVLFARDNGIYGKMLVLYHGLGLSTLYGHCSSFAVNEGDLVSRGQIVAKTGTTGLAFGDHLHYGVIIQGVAVRPVEWLDARWINHNVTLMFENAKESQ